MSIIGVAIGVTAMIVVLCVMDGFEDELKKRLMDTSTHLRISPKQTAPGFVGGVVPKDSLKGTDAEYILKTDPRIKSYSAVLKTEAILRSGRKVSGVEVQGLDDLEFDKLQKIVVESAEEQMLAQGEGVKAVRLSSVWIGQELALLLGFIPGDRITLISPTETQGPMGGVPRLKRFVIEGIYHSKNPQQELHTVYTKQRTLFSFLRQNDIISEWVIYLKDFFQAQDLSAELRDLLPNFYVQDWIQLNSNLFASLKLERFAMFVILTFIIIVASFNIVTTLTMMVLEKRKEIAILRTMGATAKQVGAIFLAEGLFIGLLGVGGGVCLAFIICILLKEFQIIPLPDFYYDQTLPVHLEPTYFLGVAFCAFFIVLLAAVYPSQKASKLAPLEAIRRGT